MFRRNEIMLIENGMALGLLEERNMNDFHPFLKEIGLKNIAMLCAF